MLLILPVLLALSQPETPKADLLLEGGVVYVASDAEPRKASIVVGEGKILFVGDPAEARRRAGAAQRIALRGAFVFPGWADAHLHLSGLGKSLEVASLRDASSAEDAAARMGKAAASLPPGAWAEGRGWDQNRWPGAAFPDALALDRVLGDRPAVARRVDGHALWVDSAALSAAGISSATPDPEGGRILRRPDGSPSGVLVDNAMALVVRVIPPASAADSERWLLRGAAACAATGLTEIQDASGYDADGIAVLESLAARNALPIRVYATVSPEPEALAAAFARGKRIGGGADFLTVRAVKAYADGALGSRGAALLADYSDEPGRRGLSVTPPERLDALALAARENGWQLWVHAIGDRANRVALDAFAKAAARLPDAPAGADRPRIEHAQVIAPEDFARFARLGVIASVQPTHATSDMGWAEGRLGASRMAGAYAWRALVEAGVRLAGGSDAPVESERPLLGFYAAVTREDLSGNPPGGWRPSQRLSRREALALFTDGAAFAAFEERSRGRVAAGFEADLTVFARDPMTISEREIPSIPIALTLVGGRVAHAAAAP
ncbi:MAG TPA: amidohydrolase [Thermoanaerobaculia bacterium]|nr:amidohydrolase [Thermoanaerobaculia bacterium]